VNAAASAVATAIRNGSNTVDIAAIVAGLMKEHPGYSERDIKWHVRWEAMMQTVANR
jgi:hypothetical protein